MSDLKNYYKKVYRCKLCKTEYGSDEQIDNGICPICEAKKTKYTRNKRK